jgi:hypothetical protein
VVAHVIRATGLRDREHVLVPGQERERDLARGGAVLLGELGQYLSAFAARGKPGLAEWRVAHDGDVVLLAPGHDRVFDGALFQVIQHLIASELARSSDAQHPRQQLLVEIAHAPSADLAGLA